MHINIEEKGKFYITSIDGIDCKTWNQFLKEIGLAFKFPDYYGQNIDAFLDCINDLTWLSQDNYVLIINNSDSLLSEDQTENSFKEAQEEFEEIIRNWNLGPQAEGDDPDRKVSIFKVIYN